MFADGGCDKRMACLVASTHPALSSGAILPGRLSVAFKLLLFSNDVRWTNAFILDVQAGPIS